MAEAGEVIRNRMSKMKEIEETAAVVAAGAIMIAEVVEVAITGVEETTRTCLLRNLKEEAEDEVAVEETDLQ